MPLIDLLAHVILNKYEVSLIRIVPKFFNFRTIFRKKLWNFLNRHFWKIICFLKIFVGRGTNTGLAIKWVVDNALRAEFGDRPEVPNKVLLITDGRARDPPVLKVESVRLQQQATVYALGIGKQIDYVELNRIASEPSERHVLYVDNFSFLERAFQKPTLSSIFCDEVCLK